MYTNKDLIDSINSQVNVIKHLWSKVNEENKNFKLVDNTRTINELMFYISYSLPRQIDIFTKWQMTDQFADYKEKESVFDYKNFASDLDNGMSVITDIINNITEEQMEENVQVFGMNQARKHYLISYINQFLGAYKTQLFLQLKTSWLTEMGSSNLRGGMDKPTA